MSTTSQSNATVVACYTSPPYLHMPWVLHTDDTGPFNNILADLPLKATIRYSFSSPALAPLLSRFNRPWREPLNTVAAPSIQITSPASFQVAKHFHMNGPEFPEGWKEFEREARLHMGELVRETHDRWCVPKHRVVECAISRKLVQEIMRAERSWETLEHAVATWKQDHRKSVVTKIW